MEIDRRTLLAGGLATLAAAPSLALPRSPAAGWYERAIIIDALGDAGDPYGPDGVLRMSDRGWAETLGTGVTMVRATVFPVGNVADPWGDYQKSIHDPLNFIAANPDLKGLYGSNEGAAIGVVHAVSTEIAPCTVPASWR